MSALTLHRRLVAIVLLVCATLFPAAEAGTGARLAAEQPPAPAIVSQEDAPTSVRPACASCALMAGRTEAGSTAASVPAVPLDPDAAPPASKIGLQIDVVDPADADALPGVLDAIEAEGWPATVYVAGKLASLRPEVVADVVGRGHELGVYGWAEGDNLTALDYEGQLAYIQRAVDAVEGAAGESFSVVHFKPQGLHQNGDTYAALNALGVGSTVGFFPLDATSFRCDFSKRAGFGHILQPYTLSDPLGLVAIPIAVLHEDSSPLEMQSGALAAAAAGGLDLFDALSNAYADYHKLGPPFVFSVRPSTLAGDKQAQARLVEFLEGATAAGGKVVPVSILAVPSASYIGIQSLSASMGAACPDGSLTLSGSYSASTYCPTYYLRAYGRYPGDSAWRLMGQVSYYPTSPHVPPGSYSYSIAATVPKPPAPKTDTSIRIRVVGKACQGGLACWPTADSYESIQETSLDVLGIKEIKVNPQEPVTTKKMTLEAVLNTGGGMTPKVEWEIQPIGSRTTKSTGGAILPERGEDNPYEFTPAGDTHGEKEATAKVTWSGGGASCTLSERHKYKLFFDKTGDDDGDCRWWSFWNTCEHNWVEYWRSDGAVPQMNLPDVYYNSSLSSVGRQSGERVEFGPAAADSEGTYTIPSGPSCPGASLGGDSGIDEAALTIEHEVRHREIWGNWQSGGVWVGNLDSDRSGAYNDSLPDHYEISTTHTATNTVDSCNLGTLFAGWGSYSYYGDNEFQARIAEIGVTGVAAKDWAKPGKNTSPAFAAEASGVPLLGQTTGSSGPAFENTTFGAAPDQVQEGFPELSGSYSDAGVDTDGDGLFDALRLTVGLEIVDQDVYNVAALLESADGQGIAWATAQAMLAPGSHSVDLTFSGQVISYSSIDGPYRVSSVELRSFDDELIYDSADDPHLTAAYLHTQFERVEAAFSGSYAERAVDDDEDGDFDRLEIDVGVTVNAAGAYYVDGFLFAGDDEIAHAEAATPTTPGAHTITLSFDGAAIRQFGSAGPYDLRNLRIVDDAGERLNFVPEAYTTAAYAPTDFQRGVAELTGVYVDAGVDTNSNSKYEHLRLSATVDALAGGQYSLTGWLNDGEGDAIEFASKSTSIAAGSAQVMTLDFDALTISDHGVAGPYRITALSLQDTTGALLSYELDVYTTAAYALSDFETGGAVLGVVADSQGSPTGATLELAGPQYDLQTTGPGGDYRFGMLPAGAYQVLVTPDNINLQRGLTGFTLTAGQTKDLDFTLQQAGSIAGTVAGRDGEPLEGYSLYHDGYEVPRYTTDEAGAYVMPGLEEGAYTLYNDISPYGDWRIYVNGVYAAWGTEVQLDVTLDETTQVDWRRPPPDGFLGGTVRDSITGQPIEVTVRSIDRLTGIEQDVTSSAADGRFELTIPAGDYDLVAFGPRHTRGAVSELSVSSGDLTTQDLSLAPKGVLSGMVRDADTGDTIPAVLAFDGPEDKVASAGADGGYSTYLDPGAYDVMVYASGWAPYETSVQIQVGQTRIEDFELLAPHVSVAGDDLEVDLSLGASATRRLTLTNTGSQPLSFSLGAGAGSLQPAQASGVAKTGGPDDFGYTYVDSDEPGGPVFAWEDISAMGATVPLYDDDIEGPFPLGFGFDFYGTEYQEVYISGNGILTFGGSSTSYGECPFPSTYANDDLVAMLASDLYPVGGAVYYATLGNAPSRRFIVQFQDVPYYGSDESVTFQAVLYEGSHAIDVRYLDAGAAAGAMSGTGIQTAHGTDGLGYACAAPDSLHDNLAVRFGYPGLSQSDWISFSPAGGEIPVGQSQDVEVLIDSGQVAEPGEYLGEIFVGHNDPLRATVQVPVHMTAQVGPEHARLSGTISIDRTGAPMEATVAVARDGQALAPSASDPADGSYERWLLGGSYEVAVTAPGYLPATRTLQLSAGATRTEDVVLTLDAPHLQLPRSTLAADVVPGQVATYTLSIGNMGPAPMSFIAHGAGWVEAAQRASAAASGGPDAFGYAYVDSDEPGGPAFLWEDVRSIGAAVALGDDDYRGPVPLGFDFNFYGAEYHELYIGSNGLLTFGSGSGSRYNQCSFPSMSTPNNLIAMLWDDLYPGAGGTIHYATLGNAPAQRFIVQFQDVPFYGISDTVAFQAVLYESSHVIEVRYLDAGDARGSGSTTGIENADGSDGLTYACNTAESLHDNLAVRFVHPAPAATWFALEQLDAQAPAYGTGRLTVKLNPFGDTPAGVYTGTIRITSDDPYQAEVSVPLTMTVEGRTLPLSAGWNLRAMPLDLGAPYTAQSWLEAANGAGESCSEISRWQYGGWDTYVRGLPFNNFAIEPGRGYFVRCQSESTLDYGGVEFAAGLPLSLLTGWNLMGVPYPTSGYTAQSLLDAVNDQDGQCSEIARWQAGAWDSHVAGLPFNDFALTSDGAYFLRCSRASTLVPEEAGAASRLQGWPPMVDVGAVQEAAGALIEEVSVTDRRDVAVAIVWRTDRPGKGWVEYGETPELGRIAHDERGEDAMATLHRATLEKLKPASKVYYRVHAAGATMDDNGAPFEVMTRATAAPGIPVVAYGRVTYRDGSPAPGAAVRITLVDGKGVRSEPLSALVDGWGWWHLSLPEPACDGATLTIEAIGPRGEIGALSHPACECTPAPKLTLAPTGSPRAFLPLVMR